MSTRLTKSSFALFLLSAGLLPYTLVVSGCSSGASSAAAASTTTTTTAGDTSYAAVYKTLTWSNATVTFPTTCTMTVTATGAPP